MNIKEKQFVFKSEIKQLLDLMINSLYSNKDIFLRELISNSSDSIDKLKFYLVSKGKDIKLNNNFYIRILIKGKKLIIRDNGIGMTYKEIINNLGTIAHSGTKKFLKNLKNKNKLNNNNEINNNLIGKFGVGFYSSFIVAYKVKVHTRSILEKEADKSILWYSEAQGIYTVNKLYKKGFGTDVILYIKDSCKEYLDINNLIKIVNKYSNYISIPIEYKIFDKEKSKFIWKKINIYEAIWLKSKFELIDNDYINFYINLTNNLGKPLIWSHNKVEGDQNYISLLYIPDTSPWNIWNRDEYKNCIKLYVKKVFIMDDIKKLIPYCLRFVQGIIDTDDLPLNISREILQNNYVLKRLGNSITNKIFKMLNNLSLDIDKYNIFWNQFGLVLKEGLADNSIEKTKITKLLRFNSSKYDIKELISLDNYVNNMKIGQDKIYYINSENYISAKNSPHLEIFDKKNIEVLFMLDRIDEWMMSYLIDYKGFNFCSINKNNNINLDNILTTDTNKKLNVNDGNIVDINEEKFFKRIYDLLCNNIKEVRITDKLEKFPAVLVTDTNDISTQMLKLLKSTGKDVPKVKYYLDININHIIIKYIKTIKDSNVFNKWINFIYYQALLIESNSLDNPVDFICLVNDLFCNFIIK